MFTISPWGEIALRKLFQKKYNPDYYFKILREFNFEVRHSPMPPDGTLRIP